VLWRGETAGRLIGGQPQAPKVRLSGEFGHAAARAQAVRRLEAFVAGEARRGLSALERLNAAIADGRLAGLARGLAYQLVEQFGVLDRKLVAAHVRALSLRDRRTLTRLGVRFGAFSLYLPGILTPEARRIGAIFAALAAPDWRPAADGLSELPSPAPRPEALALRGLRAVAGLAAPVEALERLDAMVRAAPPEAGAVRLSPALLAPLGWTPKQAETILRALGFVALRRPEEDGSRLWRRRGRPAPPRSRAAAAPAAAPASAPAVARAAPAKRSVRHRERRSGAP
jgi:ATP-dependent RNA helicase SUPV3L1/SUV3